MPRVRVNFRVDVGISVQCVGGRILIKRVRPDGGAKTGAAEWAKSVSLEPKTTLGT